MYLFKREVVHNSATSILPLRMAVKRDGAELAYEDNRGEAGGECMLL